MHVSNCLSFPSPSFMGLHSLQQTHSFSASHIFIFCFVFLQRPGLCRGDRDLLPRMLAHERDPANPQEAARLGQTLLVHWAWPSLRYTDELSTEFHTATRHQSIPANLRIGIASISATTVVCHLLLAAVVSQL